MVDYPRSLDTMMSIWNTSETAKIERLTKDAMETNVHFVDPNYNIIGHAAFIEMAREIQKKIPGAKFAHVGNIDGQHNHYRYHWEIHMGEKLLMAGFDVTEVNDAGKIVKVTGFFGDLNP